MTVVIITKHLFQTKDPKAHDHHGEYPPSCVNFVLPNVAATKNGCPPVQKNVYLMFIPYVITNQVSDGITPFLRHPPCHTYGRYPPWLSTDYITGGGVVLKPVLEDVLRNLGRFSASGHTRYNYNLDRRTINIHIKQRVSIAPTFVLLTVLL